MSHRSHRVGDIVQVSPAARVGRPNSEGGRGFVKAKRSSSPTSVAYDVEYILTRKLSKNVDPERLSPATIDNVGRRRPASDLPIQPSLLSPHYQASQQLMSTRPPPKRPRNSNLIKITTAVLLDQSRTWNGDGNDHPIIRYLQRNNNKDKGYLRRNDAMAAGVDPSKLKSQLSSDERNLRTVESLLGL